MNQIVVSNCPAAATRSMNSEKMLVYVKVEVIYSVSWSTMMKKSKRKQIKKDMYLANRRTF
jgi:hypothetical protein